MFAISSIILLLQSGHTVQALCIANSPIQKELENNGIKHIDLHSANFNFNDAFKFGKLVLNENYDLIHTHFSKDLWLIVPVLKFLRNNVPVVLTKHLGSAIKKNDILHRMLYNRLNYAIAISQVIKNNLLETTPLTRDKVVLIHNFVNIERYTHNSEANIRLRKELNIDADTCVLGMVARITPGKGHNDVIEAVKLIASKNLNFKVVVAGEASKDEKNFELGLKDKIKLYGIEKYFQFTGFRKDIPDLLSMFDAFLFPSQYEAFGLSLIEAMAEGLPNIVCYSEGVKDIAVVDVTSLAYNLGEIQKLAEHIVTLLTNPDLRKKLGENSFAEVARFSDSVFQQKTDELYKKAIIMAKTNIREN